VILRFVLWNLADSKTTIQELRRYLRDESADAFADIPGLRFKAWATIEGRYVNEQLSRLGLAFE
jgi:hypothetical protein